MKSDIEIARETPLLKIKEVANRIGIPKEDVQNYGKYMAKLPLHLIDEEQVRQHNLILVTAITPTKAGIGKTTVSIGLALGLNRLGKKAIVALREPSLGPCFGMKGGAAGGAGEGLIFAAGFISANPDPQVVSFVESFLEISGGKSPDDFAATGYDAVYIIKEAIELAGSTDGDALQEALRNLEYKGVEGVFDFDEVGEGLHSMQYGTIKDGVVAYFE